MIREEEEDHHSGEPLRETIYPNDRQNRDEIALVEMVDADQVKIHPYVQRQLRLFTQHQ